MNIHILVRRRAQGGRVIFSLIEELGLGRMFSFGTETGKGVRDEISDGGGILTYECLNPGVFHLLEFGRDGRAFLSVDAGRNRDGEKYGYEK